MKVIILDYTSGKVKYFNTESEFEEEIENQLIKKGFSLNDIEYMVVNKLEVEEV